MVYCSSVVDYSGTLLPLSGLSENGVSPFQFEFYRKTNIFALDRFTKRFYLTIMICTRDSKYKKEGGGG